MTQRYRTARTRRAYEGFLTIDIYEATIETDHRQLTIRREVHDHGHAATVLPYDPDRRTCLLVRQLRIPVHVSGGDGLFLEAAAGLIDPEDRDAAHAAEREAAEELGYRVRDLEPLGTLWTLPGLVTEKMAFFLATYGPQDRIAGERDLDADEIIDVEEWGLAAALEAIASGAIADVKAAYCLQALRIRRPDLFA